MWHLPTLPHSTPPDLAAFVANVNAHADLFSASEPLVVARAPGRLDVMGGIADYCGALVLELPLACATFVAAQPANDGFITVRSLDADARHGSAEVHIALAALAPSARLLDERQAHTLLTADPAQAWAAYAIGPLVVLANAYQRTLSHGLHMLIDSTVPAGKGLSSSAALEVASMQAIAALWAIPLSGRELAMLCQRAENLVVGAPCGIMDQMTVACGEAGQLLALHCQPAELAAPVRLPAGLAVWGIDSGIRHAVGGSDYSAVRTGAFMGYRIIAEQARLPVRSVAPGQVTVQDAHWNGYLANLSPATWERFYRERVPEYLDGAAFLKDYGGTTDSVTQIEPTRGYAVRLPTAHPIYEHQRVRLFRALLQAGASSEEERQLLGELMQQSHASYSACGLGSEGTDRLVDLAHEAGAAAGVYGAKITGGGSGGTVALLTRHDAEPVVRAIASRYSQETGHAASIFSGSSSGAIAFGTLRLT